MRVVAKAISILFHPLLLTTYLVIILGTFSPLMLRIRPEVLWPVVGFVFLVTFAVPVFNLLIFRYFGSISSLTLAGRRERILPFFFIAIIYIVVTGLFYFKLPISVNLVRLMALISFLILVSAVATIFYKVSIHSLALWGGIGILLPLNKALETGELLYPTIGVIIAAGLVMWSRLFLNAHVPREILIGSLMGFVIGLAGIVVLF